MERLARGVCTVYFLIVAWFVQRFLPGMSLMISPERSEVVAWALLEVAIVALWLAFATYERLKAKKIFVVRSPSDRVAFRLLGIWLLVCVANALSGLVRGNPVDYLLGDTYRFGSATLIFGLLYLAMPDVSKLEKLLRGIVAAYGAVVAIDLFRFNSMLLEDTPRLTTESAHEAGLLAPAVIFLMLYDRKRVWRIWSGATLLLMMLLLLRAQMLTPLIMMVLSAGLYFSLHRKFTVLLAGAAAAAILVAASLYSVSIAPEVPTYISDKLELAQLAEGPLESLQALSGVRSGEIISISSELASHPLRLLFGTGEGTLVSPDPVVPVDRFLVDKHYVHSGLFDALYHNGAIAVGAFLLFVAQLLRRGLRLHSGGNAFGLFVLVALTVTLCLLIYDLPFESSMPVLGLCFAGVSVEEQLPAFEGALAKARAERGDTRKRR